MSSRVLQAPAVTYFQVVHPAKGLPTKENMPAFWMLEKLQNIEKMIKPSRTYPTSTGDFYTLQDKG